MHAVTIMVRVPYGEAMLAGTVVRESEIGEIMVVRTTAGTLYHSDMFRVIS